MCCHRVLVGNHTISKTTWVTVQDIENISLVGSVGHATVQCNGKLSFTFWKVHDLQISSTTFFRCGLEVIDDINTVQISCPNPSGFVVCRMLFCGVEECNGMSWKAMGMVYWGIT